MGKSRTVRPAQRFNGKPLIPGDKSISHRGLIFGALAKGQTEIIDILDSADVRSTGACLELLGAKITQSANKTFIDGSAFGKKLAPDLTLDCGNSGTTIRLLMGVLASMDLNVHLYGDSSLQRRPMKRVAEPLERMGAKFKLTNSNYAPLSVIGGNLHAIDYELTVASAQIKTAVILAALFARGTTVLSGEIHSRDHTERMLKDFGVHLDCSSDLIKVRGGQTFKPSVVQVPGDPSTAAFWIAAATLIPNSQIELKNISLNPTRIGFIHVLQRMGANIEIKTTSEQSEPIGTIHIKHASLKGTKVIKDEIPSLIDEIPLLAVLATQASGITEIEGAEELRVKESDRIEMVAKNLRAMGAELTVRKDGFHIVGPQKLRGAKIHTENDHRIAMAFSIAGLLAQGETEISDEECVGVSYPNFFATLDELCQ